jgi:hypothetical protein
MIQSQFKLITTFLICAVLIIPGLAKAQKMEKPQVDKFTNDTTYFTSTEKIAGGNGAFSTSNEDIKVYLSRVKGSVYLHFIVELSVTYYHQFQVSSGNNVILKLADNSIINLKNIASVQARREGGGTLATGRMCWIADIYSQPDQADAAKILSSAVAAIRVQTDEGNLDLDIKPKNAETLQKMFQLILAAK